MQESHIQESHIQESPILTGPRMIARCYLEITNICNLDCIFCPKTGRKGRSLSLPEYDLLTDRLRGRARFLYFHLMGEPLMHPLLPRFISLAREKGFLPVITTNGTLLHRAGRGVLEARPHKVQISLHAHEGNALGSPREYMHRVMTFALEAAQGGVIVVLRLWNKGGLDSANGHLLDLAAGYVPRPWTERYDGWRMAERIYLEYDHIFEWPEEQGREHPAEEVFCYALRNQIGVLVDGTVVPCCLDHDGTMSLGNLFDSPLEDILSSPRARALYEGFSRHHATESLCRHCGYAAVTKRFRNTGLR